MNGATLAMHPPQLMFVLNLNVVILLFFYSAKFRRLSLFPVIQSLICLTGFCYNDAHFKRKLLVTTDTELSAIAAPAIIGLSINPFIG
jgi:hypothetical protein